MILHYNTRSIHLLDFHGKHTLFHIPNGSHYTFCFNETVPSVFFTEPPQKSLWNIHEHSKGAGRVNWVKHSETHWQNPCRYSVSLFRGSTGWHVLGLKVPFRVELAGFRGKGWMVSSWSQLGEKGEQTGWSSDCATFADVIQKTSRKKCRSMQVLLVPRRNPSLGASCVLLPGWWGNDKHKKARYKCTIMDAEHMKFHMNDKRTATKHVFLLFILPEPSNCQSTPKNGTRPHKKRYLYHHLRFRRYMEVRTQTPWLTTCFLLFFIYRGHAPTSRWCCGQSLACPKMGHILTGVNPTRALKACGPMTQEFRT